MFHDREYGLTDLSKRSVSHHWMKSLPNGLGADCINGSELFWLLLEGGPSNGSGYERRQTNEEGSKL